VADSMSCSRASGEDVSGLYCSCCDLLVGLPGLHVVAVELARSRLTVTVESAPGPVGCPEGGSVATSHGRRAHPHRCPVLRAPGARGVAQAQLVLPGAGVSCGGVHRAGRTPRPTTGVAQCPGSVVGGGPAATGARQHRGTGPPARHELAHPVERGGPAAGGPVVGGCGRREGPLHRGPRPRGR
jgi:hypothetical protein